MQNILRRPGDLAPGRARLTPRWMTAPDSSGTPWHDLAQGKVTVCYFVSTSHMTRDYPCDPDTKLGGRQTCPSTTAAPGSSPSKEEAVTLPQSIPPPSGTKPGAINITW